MEQQGILLIQAIGRIAAITLSKIGQKASVGTQLLPKINNEVVVIFLNLLCQG